MNEFLELWIFFFIGMWFGTRLERWYVDYRERKWSREFLEQVEREESITIGLTPTPKLNEALRMIRKDTQDPIDFQKIINDKFGDLV